MNPLEKTVRPYGLWESPISSKLLSSSSISLREVVESTSAIYSVESRPTEDGRFAIVEHTESRAKDVLPHKFSAHAEVQENGGGSIAIDSKGDIIFSDSAAAFKSVYRLDPRTGDVGCILEAEDEDIRYADFCVHPKELHLIIAIKEDRRNATPTTQATDVINTLVLIDSQEKTERTIVQGDDFYSHPKFSPSGNKVSWIQWSHPNMPWTGTVLYIADWSDGKVSNAKKISGESMSESIAQPRWGIDDTLFFASDKSGYWQLYFVKGETVQAVSLKGLEQADFAAAEWSLGRSTYFAASSGTLVAAAITHATSKIILIDLEKSTYRDLNLPFVDLSDSTSGLFRVSPTSFAVIGSTTTSPKELALVSIADIKSPVTKTLKSTLDLSISPDMFSVGEYLAIPRTAGPDQSGVVHLLYFPPHNPHFVNDPNTLPPLLVLLHGGPNGFTTPALNMAIQFWTTRGYALCAVNYTGSSGFGREYCEKLSGWWGILDTADVASTVNYLVKEKIVDGSRVGVYGGSAGGYATLQSLYMYPDLWAAGVSLYGISDIEALLADSYKFESHDVERIMLCLTPPSEKKRVMRERSARYHVEKIKAPLLLLQGTIDNIVPPEQTRQMANIMRSGGKIAKVVEFEGEGHGWIKEDSIRRALEEQEKWWKEYLVRPTTSIS
ncbi:hypothetical protein BP6252_10975 [Coleophoma cylindrospora]|uniref:Peptidase S9 prolyl oligopeptidase catalytic domain-containing protein n=1 Tax=Coleophoma cylindrospora TaxID=1849047 RepID=A0A3D8QP65_9HELO|nr:hypothetical protein BP6252_10975 [Coleophoma cylindrospora]